MFTIRSVWLKKENPTIFNIARYNSKTESAEADYTDTLGKHQVEAHWKYFTIDVKDQYECDKASHLHYEFLVNR